MLIDNSRMRYTNERFLLIILTLGIIILGILIYRLSRLPSSVFLESFTVQNELLQNQFKQDKIAFLFLTRNNLKRPEIWDKFLQGNESRYSIYCHPKEPENVSNELLKKNIIPEHIDTCWSCINLVEANILLMENALKDPQNKKFILVSESCIPIVSFKIFYDMIMQNDKSRIGIHKINTTPDRYKDINNPVFPATEFIKHCGSGCIFNRKHASLLVKSKATLEDWKTMQAADEHYNGNILRVLDKDFYSKDHTGFGVGGVAPSNNDNIKTTFDIWQKDDLDKNTFAEDDIETDSYILLKKLSNKAIDAIRKAGFAFVRKVDENTQIDDKYILALSK